MTKLRNTPTGWDAFRAFRQTPAPEFHHRHGNWKHGHYSKQSIETRESYGCVSARCEGDLRECPGRFVALDRVGPHTVGPDSSGASTRAAREHSPRRRPTLSTW